MKTAFLQRSGAAWALCLLLLIFTGLSQEGVRRLGVGGSAVVPLPPQYVGLTLDPRIIRRLLGIRLVVSDLLLIDTFVKADLNHEKIPYTTLFHSFKNALSLDPDNLVGVYTAGMYLSVVKDDTRGATVILREGASYMQTHHYTWVQAWRVPFALGYNLMFEEGEMDEGAKWIRASAEMPGAPFAVKSLAKRVATERGQLEIGSRILTDLYRVTSKPEEKSLIEGKMLAVACKQELLDLNEKFDTFLKSTGAYAFSKPKQFQAFIRASGHLKTDMLGRPLGLNSAGKIAPLEKKADRQ